MSHMQWDLQQFRIIQKSYDIWTPPLLWRYCIMVMVYLLSYMLIYKITIREVREELPVILDTSGCYDTQVLNSQIVSQISGHCWYRLFLWYCSLQELEEEIILSIMKKPDGVALLIADPPKLKFHQKAKFTNNSKLL